jgi:Type I restriction modification DNA specificity domain
VQDVSLEFANKIKELIDSLKGICAAYGLGNDGNEFKIITQVFLYKFTNDKFAYEVKWADVKIAKAERWEQALKELAEDDYEFLLLKLPPDTARLKPDHFIATLFEKQNAPDFAKLFDDTLIDIALQNNAIFSVKTEGDTKIPLFDRVIPAGWEVKKLRQFANTASGGTPLSTEKEYYENGNIAWINSGELNDCYITKAKNFITQKGLNNSSAKVFEPNILLIVMYGATAGKVSLLQIPASTNQAVCAVIPSSDIYTNFLKFALDDLYSYLINLSTGSAKDNLSQDIIRGLNFIIPQENTLVKFNKIADLLIAKISINYKQNQQLIQLRDWLLPMLMNGQVRVK